MVLNLELFNKITLKLPIGRGYIRTAASQELLWWDQSCRIAKFLRGDGWPIVGACVGITQHEMLHRVDFWCLHEDVICKN
jgi:hypothetical protein